MSQVYRKGSARFRNHPPQARRPKAQTEGEGGRPAWDSPLHPRNLLRFLELSPRKSMGQNFLIDPGILHGIAETAGVAPGQVVLEVGPGLGALTRVLLDAGADVWALEKDRGFAAHLTKVFAGEPHIQVIEGDALLWDGLELPPGPVRVIANLPYNVAIPILFRLLELRPFQDFHIMVQKEVAERMQARPGQSAYGVLTVQLGMKVRAETVLEVPPRSFYPVPKVSSSVVRLVPLEAPPADPGNPRIFTRTVRAAFAERRKMLHNALLAGAFSREVVDRALATTGIEGRRRGETLSLVEFCALARALHVLTAEGGVGAEESDRAEGECFEETGVGAEAGVGVGDCAADDADTPVEERP